MSDEVGDCLLVSTGSGFAHRVSVSYWFWLGFYRTCVRGRLGEGYGRGYIAEIRGGIKEKPAKIYSMSPPAEISEKSYSYPKWIRLVFLPLTYPHELAHYAVGKGLGMEIEMHELHVSYKPDSFIKETLMSLAPAVLALGILLGSSWVTHMQLSKIIWEYGVLMLLALAQDLYDVGKEVVGRVIVWRKGDRRR